METQSVSRRRVACLVMCACAVLWIAGCGEQRPVVAAPVTPSPVPVTLEQIVARAEAGESEWQIIWAARQSRRALPLTAADIGRLREAGVTDRAIDFMLETVTAVRLYHAIPMTQAEVIGLKQAGITDERVIAEIAYTETVFHLQVQDVIALREGGVSDEVIDFMLYTRQLERPSPAWRVVPGGL